jgi:hypothetical protein
METSMENDDWHNMDWDEMQRCVELTHRELKAMNERLALREKRIEDMTLDELRRHVSLMVTQFSVAVRDLGLIRDRLEELGKQRKEQ